MHKDFRTNKIQEQNERKNSLWMIMKTHHSKAHAMLVKIGLILSVPMKYEIYGQSICHSLKGEAQVINCMLPTLLAITLMSIYYVLPFLGKLQPIILFVT